VTAVGQEATGRGRWMLPPPLGWALCVVLGLGLGWLCRFPLVHTYLTGWALAWKAGWASIDPTLVDDGIAVFFWFTGATWVLFALLAAPLTALARRATGLPARRWWWTSAVLWVIPFLVFDTPTLR
jgi:hypothetical protein